MKKWLSLACTLLVMLAIFVFSSQPSEKSTDISSRVSETIKDTNVEALTPKWFSEDINANARKWAHIYIYCLLGFSMAATVHCFFEEKSFFQKFLLSAAACAVYSISDEIHQCFVPGRAGMIADFGIDAVGFLPCAALMCLLICLWQRGQKKMPR